MFICGPERELTSPPVKGANQQQIHKLSNRYHRLCARHVEDMSMFDFFELSDCIMTTLDQLETLGINTETHFLTSEELKKYDTQNDC
jgi:hypothetical protein